MSDNSVAPDDGLPEDESDLVEIVQASDELAGVHRVLDQLAAPGGNDVPADTRLRGLLREALGRDVPRLVNVNAGKKLADWYLEQTNCAAACSCHLCSDARAIR